MNISKEILKKLNIVLLILPVMIFSLGYMTLLSTSPEKAKSQLLIFIIGYFVFILVSLVDFSVLRYFSINIYKLTIALLVFTFLVGELRLGSARWLNLGIVTFQPSEISKLGLIIFLSYYLTYKKDSAHNIRDLFKVLTYSLVSVVLIFLQPDLGTSLILIGVIIGIFIFAEVNKLYFFFLFIFLSLVSNPLWHILHDYQKVRILVFFNPNLDLLGKGYNVMQALIAVGSGGFWGVGFGRGTQTHLNFLPVYWTDFIFASFAEEWGFVGVFILLLLYFLLFITLLYIINKVSNKFGSLLCVGVFFVFFLQFLINVGMNLGLMPVTGITLPLMSHGGTSIISSMIMLGIVHSVYIHR